MSIRSFLYDNGIAKTLKFYKTILLKRQKHKLRNQNRHEEPTLSCCRVESIKSRKKASDILNEAKTAAQTVFLKVDLTMLRIIAGKTQVQHLATVILLFLFFGQEYAAEKWEKSENNFEQKYKSTRFRIHFITEIFQNDHQDTDTKK